jgi:hypothetical protein
MIIDHVCLASRNAHVAAARLRAKFGLESYDGGWFPFLGIMMKVVPIPNSVQYIELESVIDVESAMMSDFGQWFHSVSRESALIGWTMQCTRDELEGLAERLKYPIKYVEGFREMPDGSTLAVYAVGPPTDTWQKGGLPNFVAFDPQRPHPSERTTPVAMANPLTEIAWVEYCDPFDKLKEWLGDSLAELPIKFVEGNEQKLLAAAFNRADGTTIEIRSDPAGPDERQWREAPMERLV